MKIKDIQEIKRTYSVWKPDKYSQRELNQGKIVSINGSNKNLQLTCEQNQFIRGKCIISWQGYVRASLSFSTPVKPETIFLEQLLRTI